MSADHLLERSAQLVYRLRFVPLLNLHTLYRVHQQRHSIPGIVNDPDMTDHHR